MCVCVYNLDIHMYTYNLDRYNLNIYNLCVCVTRVTRNQENRGRKRQKSITEVKKKVLDVLG